MNCRQIVDRSISIVKVSLSSYYKNSYMSFVDSRQMYPVVFLRVVIMTIESRVVLSIGFIIYNLSTVSTTGGKILSCKGLSL